MGRFGLAHFRFVCFIEHKYQSSDNTCTEAGTRQLVYTGCKIVPTTSFALLTMAVFLLSEHSEPIYYRNSRRDLFYDTTHTPTVLTMCVNDRVMPDFYPCLVVFNY